MNLLSEDVRALPEGQRLNILHAAILHHIRMARIPKEIHEHRVYSESSHIPFRSIEPLGRGAFGIVDKVEGTSEPFLGRIYARKSIQLPFKGSEREKALASIKNEVAIVKRVRHDHVVSLIATYLCGRYYAMIMHPIAERNLQEYLAHMDDSHLDNMDLRLREKIPQWFGCLISGVAYLHKQRIRHRDIKPSNILIKAGNILLTDFGISFEVPEDTILTETITPGTPMYRAPEVGECIRSGRQADVFSLGAVFVEMLTVYSGHEQLAHFGTRRNGTYASNIGKVFQWIDSLCNIATDIPWYSTMLFLSKNMLQKEREERPTIDALSLCWSYHPFSAVPPTFCQCIPFLGHSGGTHINNALQTASRKGHKLVVNLLIERGAEINDSGALAAASRAGRADIVELLLQKRADVNSKGVIQIAAAKGFETIVRLLLAHKADVDAKVGRGRTALHLAVDREYRTITWLLPGHKADVGANENGSTPLHMGASGRHEAVVQLLLEYKANVNARDADGLTPLHMATMCGYETVVRLLLEHGADIDAVDKNGLTPLEKAVRSAYEPVMRLLKEKAETQATQLLLDNRFDIHADNFKTQDALLWAAERGHKGVERLLQKKTDAQAAQLLLDNGFDIRTDSFNTQDTLLWAAEGGHEAVIPRLPEMGADAEAEGVGGMSALHRAARNGHEGVMWLLQKKKGTQATPLHNRFDIHTENFKTQDALLRAAEWGDGDVVQLLLEEGADVEVRDVGGRTALHKAAGNGHKAVVQQLLEKRADVNAKGKYGEMPLHEAAEKGHGEVVKLLLEKGADIWTSGSYGRTALHWAAIEGHEIVLQLLLEEGADIEAKSANSLTALHWAVCMGHQAVVRLLLKNGADVKAKNDFGRLALHMADERGYEKIAQLLQVWLTE